MQTIDHEIKLKSDLYGEFRLIDMSRISLYPQIDIQWAYTKAKRVEVSHLLNEKDPKDYSGLWCVKLNGLKKDHAVLLDSLFCFPNHIEEKYRKGSYFLYNRINDIYEGTNTSIALIRATRLIHWELLNRPVIYFYNYIEPESQKVWSCTQENKDFFKQVSYLNNFVAEKVYTDYNKTGMSLALVTFDQQELYNIALNNNIIDKTLHKSTMDYINSLNK